MRLPDNLEACFLLQDSISPYSLRTPAARPAWEHSPAAPGSSRPRGPLRSPSCLQTRQRDPGVPALTLHLLDFKRKDFPFSCEATGQGGKGGGGSGGSQPCPTRQPWSSPLHAHLCTFLSSCTPSLAMGSPLWPLPPLRLPHRDGLDKGLFPGCTEQVLDGRAVPALGKRQLWLHVSWGQTRLGLIPCPAMHGLCPPTQAPSPLPAPAAAALTV